MGGKMENITLRDENKHGSHTGMLNIRNALAVLAAVCFVLSIFIDNRQFMLKAVAYGVGALAYLGELMAITHLFKKRVDGREIFMPVVFGVMYILLGVSYAIEHIHL